MKERDLKILLEADQGVTCQIFPDADRPNQWLLGFYKSNGALVLLDTHRENEPRSFMRLDTAFKKACELGFNKVVIDSEANARKEQQQLFAQA